MDNRARLPSEQRYAALAGRRYGVPPSMVARATERRLDGDWRGACAAARIDVRFDVDRAGRQYGAQTAAMLAADLHHLVPDLLRWHAPRVGTTGLLAPGRVIVLADYHEAVLTAHLPRTMQRIELHLGPGRAEDGRDRTDWSQARYLWDARETPALLRRMGGGDRTPFFHRDGTPRRPDGRSRDKVSLVERVLTLQDTGQIVEAWAAAGVPPVQDFADTVLGRVPAEEHPPEPMTAMVSLLAPVATAMLAIPSGRGGVVLRAPVGPVPQGVLLMLGEDGLRAHRVSGPMVEDLPAVPHVLWRRMPDLELLRAGLIEADELHPLVRAGLFPEQADPGYHPRMPHLSTVETIDCGGSRHRIALAGRIGALDHAPADVAREQALRDLGGPVAPCVEAIDAWRGRRHAKLPPELAPLKNHGLAALQHANVEEVERLLDAGFDVTGFRDRSGRGPLQLAAAYGVPADVIDALRAAGAE